VNEGWPDAPPAVLLLVLCRVGIAGPAVAAGKMTATGSRCDWLNGTARCRGDLFSPDRSGITLEKLSQLGALWYKKRQG
jgi:hypothetical protein